MTDQHPEPSPPRSWAPTPEEPPAWLDQDVYAETAHEDDYDAWADAQEPATETWQPWYDERVEESSPELAAPIAHPESAPEPLGSRPAPEEEPPAEPLGSEPAPEPSWLPTPEPTWTPEPEPEPEPDTDPGWIPEVEPAPGDEDAQEPGAAVRSGVGRGALALLTALAVALAGAAAFLGLLVVHTAGATDTDASRSAALDAARAAARVIFSYDYRHLDQDFALGRGVSTGRFLARYRESTIKLTPLVAKRKAVMVADVSDAAVVDATRNRVTTLVFLDQQGTSTLVVGSDLSQNRLEMTLVRVHGRWLVQDVRAF